MEFENLLQLLAAPTALTWQMVVMMIVGGILIYLAIAKEYEPMLLLPIGFGAILTNLPLTGIAGEEGLFGIFYAIGIKTEIFPLLLFIGLGAMTDFGPLLENPKMALLGAAGHFGIFATLVLTLMLGFGLNEAAAISAIGTMDGPTSIYVASILSPHMLAPIAVAAYSYMSLVPIIQPPVMRLLTTDAERKVRMPYTQREVPKITKILFPIVVTIIVSLLAPVASPLIAALMFGNLMRESEVVERLANTSQNEIANVTTIFLGLTIGATMTGSTFIQVDTLLILALGLLAFVLDMVGGVLFAKLLYVSSGKKFNPLLGAAGISAFPMSARVVQRVALEYDHQNFLLMHAMGANTAGQLGSVMAGGVLLALITGFF
jgi:sodium ion-translocating decarboxylase beta subunit